MPSRERTESASSGSLWLGHACTHVAPPSRCIAVAVVQTAGMRASPHNPWRSHVRCTLQARCRPSTCLHNTTTSFCIGSRQIRCPLHGCRCTRGSGQRMGMQDFLMQMLGIMLSPTQSISIARGAVSTGRPYFNSGLQSSPMPTRSLPRAYAIGTRMHVSVF